MKLYLSSYKLGNKKDFFKKWLQEHDKKIVFISNARDWLPDSLEKEKKIKENIIDLQELGFEVIRFDLRNYFHNETKLREDLKPYKAFYVIGGNVYTLRLAMKYSGFDNYLKELVHKDEYLYAGYSAGICVLSPTLAGLNLVDKPINPYNDEPVLYDGLEILDFIPVPHYKSEHPESAIIDKVVELFNKKKINYKTMRDGDVIIFEFP